jgi:dTDP-4-dehydrorhamnose 3,5-epimerase
VHFIDVEVAGARLVLLEPHHDERGFFARAFSAEEFRVAGLNPAVAQANRSFNRVRGTLRGMHYQVAPAQEAKLVRCVRGAIYDVVVDLRSGSATEHRWAGAELSEDNGTALYVPEGCAHGFITLVDDTLVSYQVSAPHNPDAERGLRWDDPAIGIGWPMEPAIISEKDRSWPPMSQG